MARPHETRVWRNEVAAMYRGEPHHPVARALPRCCPLQSCEGVTESSRHGHGSGPNRIPLRGAEPYCHRVASVVDCFGGISLSEPSTMESRPFGMALQLTNIPDVGEDARRDRIICVGRNCTLRCPVTTNRAGARNGNFRRLMEFQIEARLGYYRAAFASSCRRPQDAARGDRLAGSIRTMLEEIRDGGCRVLVQRTR